MQSIHQHIITSGITPKFLYQGVERLSPKRAEEVHVWAVQIVGGPMARVTDSYRVSTNEYLEIRDQKTTLTEQYMLAFAQRMTDLMSLGSGSLDYEEWLDVKGVGFGVTAEDTPENQAFWRGRFDHDLRCFKEFERVIGGAVRAREFFSNVLAS